MCTCCCRPAPCSSPGSSHPGPSWQPRRECTEKPPASGRRAMRSASRASQRSPEYSMRAPASGRQHRAGIAEVDSGMRSVVVDKLASVTQACGLTHEVRIAADIPAEEGVVVGVEVLTNKTTYNTLELTSGRMAKVGKGDIVAGALGHRQALFGYSGHIPAAVQPGDILQMLNIGGVIGVCDSINPEKGKPFDCRVLGVALTFPFLGERIGVPARVGKAKLDYESKLDTKGVPGGPLAGSCTDAGETAAACAIVS